MKRIIAFFLLFTVLMCFPSCSENARPDIPMLSERMASINGNYAFDYFDTFIYEGAEHVFFSLCSEDDVLLSLETDEYGNIDAVTVTAFAGKMTSDREKTEFLNFSEAVIGSFATLTEKEIAEKNKNLSSSNIQMYFTDLYETYSSQRHNFIFSSNSSCICLRCEYYESEIITDALNQD